MNALKLSELTLDDIRTICRFRVRIPDPSRFQVDHVVLTADEQRHVDDLTVRLLNDKTGIMNEATLWSRAIYPLLMLAEQPYVRAWVQVALRAQYPHVELQGVADGVIGMSISGDVEVPYLVVVEAKRGLEASDPRPQLYGQLLAAARLNWEHDPQPEVAICGCYTIVDSWTFVCAEVVGLDTDSPSMAVEFSREYDQKAEAETILKILKAIVAERASYHQEQRV